MREVDQVKDIDAFADGELELTRRLAMEERLQQDPALRARVAELRELREAIHEGADYHRAPAALRKRLQNLSDAGAAMHRAHHPSTLGRIGRWAATGWRPMAASLGVAAALVLTANLWWLHSSQDDRLMDEVTASHVRSTLGQHLVDVASSDHHTVKPWLSSKLDFSPPVTDLKEAGSTFLGGRVDYLDGRPVAALVYRQGQHVVNSFVWPGAAAEGEPRFATERGYRTAHWSRNGMTHWVISDLNDQEFRAVVRVIEKAD